MASPGFSYWLNPGSYFDKVGNPMEEWLEVWRSMTPDYTPFTCTMTASDAINLLPSMVAYYHEKPRVHNILVFDKCFGAARGSLAALSAVEKNRKYGIALPGDYKIVTPSTRINILIPETQPV
jgi:hypothetical protein